MTGIFSQSVDSVLSTEVVKDLVGKIAFHAVGEYGDDGCSFRQVMGSIHGCG